MSEKYCYFNDQVIREEELKIDPYDLGFLRGYAVFDFMTTVNHKPFLLEDHYQRLTNSAKTLNLEVPVNQDDYRIIVEELLEKNGIFPVTVRTILTGGVSPDGLSLGSQPTFLVLIKQLVSFDDRLYQKGAKVITVDYTRYLPSIKTTHYIEAVRYQIAKRQAEAVEVVYIKDGQVFEASTSNIFLVKNKKIITPDQGILGGITRKLVLGLIKDRFEVEERPVELEELLKADEVFLTASGKNVMPVVKIDDRQIGTGQVGEMTKKIMGLYQDYCLDY